MGGQLRAGRALLASAPVGLRWLLQVSSFPACVKGKRPSGLTPTQSFKRKTSTPLLAIAYCQKAVSHMATPNYRLLKKCSLVGCPGETLLHGGREECVLGIVGNLPLLSASLFLRRDSPDIYLWPELRSGFAFLGAAWTRLSRCLYGPPTKNVQNRTCLLSKHVLQSFINYFCCCDNCSLLYI